MKKEALPDEGPPPQLRNDEPASHRPPLDGQEHQRLVSSSFPAGRVRGGDESVDLGCGQEGHEPFAEPLGWDGKDSLDQQRVLGVTQSGAGEH